jgi:hypothetical protein
MNKKHLAMKALKFGGKVLKHTAVFSLGVLEQVLEDSAKEKEYEPTLHEISDGEKMPITGKYYIPDKKF